MCPMWVAGLAVVAFDCGFVDVAVEKRVGASDGYQTAEAVVGSDREHLKREKSCCQQKPWRRDELHTLSKTISIKCRGKKIDASQNRHHMVSGNLHGLRSSALPPLPFPSTTTLVGPPKIRVANESDIPLYSLGGLPPEAPSW
jgi:hypothetical protein